MSQHPDVVSQFKELTDQGRYREALAVALAALAEGHRRPPAGGLGVAAWLDYAGFAYLRLGEYASAAGALEQAQNMLSGRRGGEARLLYADCVSNLASARRATGRFLEAKALYEEALAIRRELSVAPERDAGVAQVINNVAVVLHELGEYQDALDLHRQALDIDVSALGRSHPSVAQDLNNIGCLHMDAGAYAEAATCHHKALTIRRKRLPPDHPAVAESLSNLASLALTTRDLERAADLYRAALEIKAAAFGEDSPQAVRTMHNLASTMHVKSQYSEGNGREAAIREAAALENRALGIAMRQASVGHPDSAAVLRGVAYRFAELGDHARAETLFTAALKITRRRNGSPDSELAESLAGRGWARMAMGQEKLAAAGQDLQEALGVMVRSLGKTHPDVAAVLDDLAQLCAATGRDEEALQYFQQAAAIDTETIGQVFLIASEARRAGYIDALRWKYELFLSFATARSSSLPGCIPAAFELVLRRKGIEAEMLAAQRSTIMRGRYPEVEDDLRRLFQLRAQSIRKFLDGPRGADPAEHHRMLSKWRAEQEELEVALTLQVPELPQSRISRTVAVADLARQLPAGSALVEIARVSGHRRHWLAEPAAEATYMAFILLAGCPEKPRLVELGPADLIDDTILAAFPFPGTDPARGTAVRRQLREIIFDPLLPHLDGRSRLLISPDGAIQFVPFGLLETGDGTHLIDTYQIDYLSSGRDILQFKAAPHGGTDPLIVADPDFDLTATPESAPAAGPFLKSPGFGVEGKWLRWKLKSEAWLGPQALKGKVRGIRSPQILHFATHGFVDDPAARITYTHRWLTADETQAATGTSHPVLNPLLFSGLALAGANAWKAGGTPAADAEDGILTAEDVTSMDLLGTELVVLSACDTARGGLRTGEGVLGLRRSFAIAGARVLIMSLFQVPGWLAFELTRELYTRVLEEQVSYAEALRAAQLALKRRYPNTPEWGYFICQGDTELHRAFQKNAFQT